MSDPDIPFLHDVGDRFQLGSLQSATLADSREIPGTPRLLIHDFSAVILGEIQQGAVDVAHKRPGEEALGFVQYDDRPVTQLFLQHRAFSGEGLHRISPFRAVDRDAEDEVMSRETIVLVQIGRAHV